MTGAPGTDVTGNTVRAICSGGISVAGVSPGVTVENNIVQAVTSGGANPCPAGTGTGRAAPVAAGGTLTLPIPSISGVPAAKISAVVMNVTVTQPTHNGHLTVYPDGVTRPNASNLNFSAGETVPNLVTVQGRNGKISFYNASSGQIQLIIDEYGFYMAAS